MAITMMTGPGDNVVVQSDSSVSWDYKPLLLTDIDPEDVPDGYDDALLSSSSSLSPIKLSSTGRRWHVFRIPFRHAIRIVCSLPLGAFIFCVIWAMYTDYDRATFTLCSYDNRRIRNYLPSLSAAVGDFPESKFIWKFCVFLHAAPRFLFASMYYNYLRSLLKDRGHLALVTCSLHCIENLGLLGLTAVSSKQNLPIHATSFGVFVVSSELYMILLCWLLGSVASSLSNMETKSLWVKRQLVKVILVSSILLFITYFRHEAKCEEGVYTVFALVEYILVLVNMGFHLTAYWDFYDRIIIVDLFRPFLVSTHKQAQHWRYRNI